MSDHSISIVPRQSNYPHIKIKGKEILEWLVTVNIVQASLSDCVLSTNMGYAISEEAINVCNLPEYLPFQLITNGLEIITERTVFHTGENGIDSLICPTCHQDIA